MATTESTPTMIGIKRKLSTSVSSPSPATTPGVATKTSQEQQQSAKRRKSSRTNSSGTDAHNDSYCWICHKEGEVICCETCPRVFHIKCIQLETAPTEDWVCPECVLILTAENMGTRSRAMRLLEVDQLCVLLKHALGRMKTVSGIDPFTRPVDPTEFPSYKDYITCPMDLSTMEKNIKKKRYGSTEAFLAAAKWILHNCIIFNSTASKLTSIAKSLVKVCKHEMQEIENCPDCYLNAHTRKDSWFVAACRIPHLLVWAKLKGFPFWPGKAMRVNSEDNVDIRFFGAHDRAWIPIKDVFLYSNEPPVLMRNKKKGNLDGCVHEVELYIKNITDKFGAFEYAPSKINYDPKKEEEQIKIIYPKCNLPFELGSTRRRARTYSFSGSERSVTNTPTPSDMDTADETIDTLKDEEEEEELDDVEDRQDEKDEDEVPPMMTEAIVGKVIVDDELMATSEEDVVKETTTTIKATETRNKSTDEKLKTLRGGVDKKSKKNDMTSRSGDKVQDSDRAAESPPCEVSSTTPITDADKMSKRLKLAEAATADNTPDAEKSGVEKSSKKSSGEKLPETTDSKDTVITESAVIAETSETVVIEGHQEDEDEDEIDDVEEIEEIDDVEPEDEDSPMKAADPVDVAEDEERPEAADAEVDAEAEIDDEETEKDIQDSLTVKTSLAAVATPKDVSNQSVETESRPVESEKTKKTNNVVVEKSTEKSIESKKSSTNANDEEEIDDVEPDAEMSDADADGLVEEIFDDEEEEEEEVVEPQNQHQDVDTSRLLASGVSVTIVEKSRRQKSTEEATKKPPTTTTTPSTKPSNPDQAAPTTTTPAAPKVATEIGLGSDISVTLVQKKKTDLPVGSGELGGNNSATSPAAASAAARTPKISVKKESELLQDPSSAKDIVQVHNIVAGGGKPRKPFPSKSIDSADGSGSPSSATVVTSAGSNKNPPDPIVTISKVQSLAVSATNQAENSMTQTAQAQRPSTHQASARPMAGVPPIVSSPHNIPCSSPLTRTTPYPAVSSMGSLASILGAPRMSGPGFRPGMPPQPSPHNMRPVSSGSPLMLMPGPPRGLPMPSLHPRPPTGPLSCPPYPVPPSAGPVSEQLNRVANKLVDFMRLSLDELFRELSGLDSPEATIRALQIEMEKMQWRHQQEIAEYKRIKDTAVMEVRQMMEADKQKCIADLKKQFEIERQKVVTETKKKQWCANCGKEAIFYCCWNTSYCDYPCQQAHWPSHMSSCAQNQSNQDEDGGGASGSSAGAGSGAPDHVDVMDGASHFLQQQANQRNMANGMMDPTRGIPGGPVVMPFGPQHGINPRMMNQLNMRFAAAAAAHASHASQSAHGVPQHPRFPGQLRFPGSYFM